MDVSIDYNACVGCGICANLCSDTFRMGGDNKAHVKHEPAANHEACAREAVEDCPTQAILLH